MSENKNRNDDERETDVTGGTGESLYSEAIPGADRDRDTTYDSSTSGGAAGEVQDLSDTPPPAKRGKDMDH